jgi:hypothetical protein
MGREEAIITPAIAVDDIDQKTDLRITGRSPTSDQGFDDGVVDSACKQYTESGRGQDKEYLQTGFTVLDDDNQKTDIEGHPRQGVRQGENHRIEEE